MVITGQIIETKNKTMEKKLKDYLHLYMGCECLLKMEENNKKLNIRVLRSLPFLFGELHAEFGGNTGFPICDVKPILRPLSDMTEEEFEGLREITGYPNHNATFEGAEGKHIRYRYGKKSTVNGFKTSLNTDQMRPDMLVFLLSKHFDLLGLIESGLAADKTKIVF